MKNLKWLLSLFSQPCLLCVTDTGYMADKVRPEAHIEGPVHWVPVKKVEPPCTGVGTKERKKKERKKKERKKERKRKRKIKKL